MKSIKQKTVMLGVVVVASIITATFFTNCGKGGFTATAPDASAEDPFLGIAWHISNSGQEVFAQNGGQRGFDLNLSQTWLSGLTGKGIRILISDDGVEDTHVELKNNYLYGGVSKDYTKSSPYLANSAEPITSDDNHGTAVAGLVAAAAFNGVGSRGVAHRASIASANFLSSAVSQTEGALTDQVSGDFDIFSMSWGARQNNLVGTVASFQQQLRFGALNGRNGKGAIFVKSAGNDFYVLCKGSTSEYCIGNVGFDQDNASPYLILSGALNSAGEVASYSSPGSAVWVSSFGGEFGDDFPAMITSDRMGCNYGFSTSSVEGTLAFERGGLGNIGCNYTSTFNGTSAAAPVLTGAIALLLEANPSLTWRDVKYILAKTAVPVNYVTSGSIAHPNDSTPTGAVWEQVWVLNSAGFKFHNWYGFGKVDVDAAVALAKAYGNSFGPLQETNWADNSAGLNLPVPDNSSVGEDHSMTVNSNLRIEAVQLRLWVTHTNISDLAVELTSPTGTKSIVVNMNNSLRGVSDYIGETFLTNAFFGENSQGVWTIKVIDGKSTNTGTLTRWSLNFLGSN